MMDTRSVHSRFLIPTLGHFTLGIGDGPLSRTSRGDRIDRPKVKWVYGTEYCSTHSRCRLNGLLSHGWTPHASSPFVRVEGFSQSRRKTVVEHPRGMDACGIFPVLVL